MRVKGMRFPSEDLRSMRFSAEDSRLCERSSVTCARSHAEHSGSVDTFRLGVYGD